MTQHYGLSAAQAGAKMTALRSEGANDFPWWQGPHATVSQVACEDEVLHFACLVKLVLGRLALLLPRTSSYHLDNLTEQGIEALTRAMRSYDPQRDGGFEGYALSKMQKLLLDDLAWLAWPSPLDCWWMHRIQEAMTALTKESRREPTDEAIAGKLGLSHRALLRLYEKGPATVAPTGDIASLAKATESLSEQAQVLLSLYYCDNLTVREVAEVLGSSETRVRQLHGKSIAYLRSQSAGSRCQGAVARAAHGVSAGQDTDAIPFPGIAR